MLRKPSLLICCLLALVIASCGEPDQPAPSTQEPFVAADFLPDRSGGGVAGEISIARSPGELIARLGQLGAEEARSYGMIGLASCAYRDDQGNDRLSVEIAQFPSGVHAFGYYARTRSFGIDTLTLGMEAYFEGNSLYFAQDKYVVTLSATPGTDEVRSTLLPVAITVSAMIESNPPPPEIFASFPDSGRIVPSDRWYAKRFLDIEVLTGVYATVYNLGGDTLVLFACEDGSGLKLADLALSTGSQIAAQPQTEGFGFDEDYGYYTGAEHDPPVLAGLKDGWLLGALGYEPNLHRDFLTEWINGWSRMRPTR
jgi:hypothetical protein